MEITFENIIWPAMWATYLTTNCLTSINNAGLQSVLKIFKIALKGNPWRCDLKLCWLSHTAILELEGDKVAACGSTVVTLSRLTPKHRETHGCVVSTVATDALVLKHQVISIHNADYTFIVLDQFHIKDITLMLNNITK